MASAKRVGIVYREIAGAQALAGEIATWLASHGHAVWVRSAEDSRSLTNEQALCDLMLVLGGDGTILSTARLCAPAQIPIVGINFGHVGFLAELEPGEALEQLAYYLDGDYWIDERAMLAGILTIGDTSEQFEALNDIVVVRGAEPRVIRLKLWVDDYYYSTMSADGIIVATATGSTAYNLAAGGPVLHPSVRGSVLTPIAPHLATDRPMVFEPHSLVRLELLGDSGGAVISADGQINRAFDGGASVVITNSAHVTRFLRRRPPSHFYHLLNAKLTER
jgi:NAD+ kinase